MPYIANHMIRTSPEKLYNKGDVVDLPFEDLQRLLKHKAVTKVGNDPAPKAKAESKKKTDDTKAAKPGGAKDE
jgi:hypothetical protein